MFRFAAKAALPPAIQQSLAWTVYRQDDWQVVRLPCTIVVLFVHGSMELLHTSLNIRHYQTTTDKVRSNLHMFKLDDTQGT